MLEQAHEGPMTVFVGPDAPELDPVGCRVPTGSVIDPSLPRKERSTLIITLCAKPTGQVQL